MSKKVTVILAGMLAGLVNGLFGMGGGMILVPAFTRLAKMEQKTALATSVAVIAPLCALSASIYFFKGTLDFAAAAPFLLGGLIGGVLGGRLFMRVSPTLLRRGFGLLLIYGGVKALLRL